MCDMMTFPKTVEEFMEQYKVVDREHIYSNGTEYVPIFRMKQWFEHLERKPMTNADKYFHNATDEEIAELMFWNADDAEALWCKGWFTCTKSISCKDCFINWLKQEVKENG